MNSFFTYTIFRCCCLRERSELFLFCKIYWEPFPPSCIPSTFIRNQASKEVCTLVKWCSNSMVKHSTSNLGLHFKQPTTTETYKLHKETKMKRAPKKQKQNTESAQKLRRGKIQISRRPTQGRNFVLCWICPVLLGDQQKLKFWEELQQQETGKKKKKRGTEILRRGALE